MLSPSDTPGTVARATAGRATSRLQSNHATPRRARLPHCASAASRIPDAHPPGSLVSRLVAPPGRADRLTHLEELPPREAVTAPWPAWVPDEVREAYVARGVALPWRHQAEAADHARAGRHVVVSTGTASGKSLAFQLPALAGVHRLRGPGGERGSTVLYLAPTKALAQDQWAGLRALGLDTRVTTHDGDSSREQRDWARDHGEYVLTNPDMLHRSLLPGHERWARFLSMLDVVVVDEAHHYRGVFGAHVAQVLRRLRRVCARYGAQPDVRAGLGHHGRPGRHGEPAHRAPGRGGHRRRLAPGPGLAGLLGAALHLAHGRERRPGPALRRRPRRPTC